MLTNWVIYNISDFEKELMSSVGKTSILIKNHNALG